MNRRFVLLLAWLAFIVYGSLVPLDFRPMALEAAWQALRSAPFLELGVESRADWVANGVLYLPLGLLATHWLAGALRWLPFALIWLLAAAGCVAVAVGVEFAQVFFPPRTVSQNDLIAECIGSLLGASLVPFIGRWLDRLAHAWTAGGARLVPRLLELYAVAYLALCFFPYDLLLSRGELLDKAASGLWGWLLAPQDRGGFFTVLQLTMEVALSAPFGVLLARRGAFGRAGQIKAAAAGFALGMLIEGGQFFVASGVSQGASVVSRVMGVWVGAWLGPRMASMGPAGLRSLLARLAWPLLVVYVPVLLVANGWFRQPWQGVEGAAKTWAELRLMPFYYHYWTTEALALFSLGSVVLMYLPLALAAWARAASARRLVLGVGGLVLFVELSKLFLVGARPDPTNVLIAIAASVAALKLLSMSHSDPRSVAAQRSPPTAAQGRAQRSGWFWLLMIPLVALEALRFPALVWLLLPLLVICSAIVWWRPVLALALVPAALPVLDLAPWTGRVFIDEFDLLLGSCLGLALFRTQRATPTNGVGWLAAAFWLLGLSLLASTLRALWPALADPQMPSPDALTNFFSPWSALRIVKGAAWAGLFILLWRRLAESSPDRLATCFSAGVMTGLALVVSTVVWERASFAGLWDFSADFRVTGMFSAMHRGGAYIECYLASASAFATWSALRARRAIWRVAAMLLLAAASYAVMVTYSRNGYAAMLVALLLAAVVGLPRNRPGWQTWLPATGLVLALGVAAVPLLAGSYARERLSQTGRDFGIRAAHWADALQMRDKSWLSSLVGMGLGRYPETHFWRSQETVRAATWRLVDEGGNLFLRLGSGATLYIEQILARPAPGELMLSVDLSSARGDASLTLALCEKWGLTSLNCVPIQAVGASGSPVATALPGSGQGVWQRVQVGLDPAKVLASAWPLRAPLKLSLFTPPGDVSVDVDNLRLVSSAGEELLANGDFSAGMDRWFFATDIDPPWHVHNLALAVLFDQGWLGVFAWVSVLGGALGLAVQRVLQGNALLPAAGVAAMAFLVSGTLNSLIDAPRFLWLLLVLLWLAAQPYRAPAPRAPTASGGQRTWRRDIPPS